MPLLYRSDKHAGTLACSYTSESIRFKDILDLMRVGDIQVGLWEGPAPPTRPLPC